MKYFPIFGYMGFNGKIVSFSLDLSLRALFYFHTVARKCLYTRNCFAIISSLIITKLSLRKLLFNPRTLNIKGYIPLHCDF